MIVDIGISQESREKVCKQLNILLANEYILYTKTLNYHWNLKGPHFGPLHALFKQQYEDLFDIIDEVAERVTALGFFALGSLKECLDHTRLQETPAKHLKDMLMIGNLLKDHEAIIKSLRPDVELTAQLNDAGTNNFLADLLEKHEKMAWMLRSHLEA